MVTRDKSSAIFEPLPFVVFLGDFNAGKTSLINALLRKVALHDSRLESKALPTFLSAGFTDTPVYSALSTETLKAVAKTQEEFLVINKEIPEGKPYKALAARIPNIPFSKLVFVDTAGTSTDSTETMQLVGLSDANQALVVMVTDIEYWSARHTMESIALHSEQFGDRLIVVANKADHINANEIQRIKEKACKRMEDFGIATLPRFFALSARLESARLQPHNEYRNRNKKAVRTQCDAAFDALRVALYEFETRHTQPGVTSDFDTIYQAPLAASLINLQEGCYDAV